MQIDVSTLLKKTGNRDSYHRTWSSDDLGLRSELYSIGESIEVSLLLYNAEGIIEVEGSYGGVLYYYCNRCLKSLNDQLQEEVRARFYPPGRDYSKNLDQDESREIFRGNYTPDETVDMGEVIREDIVLSRPMQELCRSDCEGLCPKCGQNLNEDDCGHEIEHIDPRLSKLQELDLSEDD